MPAKREMKNISTKTKQGAEICSLNVDNLSNSTGNSE